MNALEAYKIYKAAGVTPSDGLIKEAHAEAVMLGEVEKDWKKYDASHSHHGDASAGDKPSGHGHQSSSTAHAEIQMSARYHYGKADPISHQDSHGHYTAVQWKSSSHPEMTSRTAKNVKDFKGNMASEGRHVEHTFHDEGRGMAATMIHTVKVYH